MPITVLRRLFPLSAFVRNFPIILVVFTLCNLSNSAFAQPWLHTGASALKHDAGMLDVFEKFETYWQDKPYVKGKGYKQYQRWMQFVKPRVYPQKIFTIENANYQRYFQSYHQKGSRAIEYANWEMVGPVQKPIRSDVNEVSGMGRMNCIYFHPNNANLMYAGSPSGGLWQFDKKTRQWILVNDQLPCIGISDIEINHSNTDEMYILTGDGDGGDTYSVGMLKSTDGGKTFAQTVFSAEQQQEVVARRIVALSADAQTQLATTSMGIYRTSDGWESGEKVLNGHFKDIEVSPNNSDVVYAAKYSDSDVSSGIYRSLDGGKSFDRLAFADNDVSSISRIELAVSPAEPTAVYAVCANKYDGGFYAIYRSLNSGTDWTLVQQQLPVNIFGWTLDGLDKGGQAWYDLAVAVDPTNINTIYVGAVNIWKSTDGGASWQFSSDWLFSDPNRYVHADIHDLVFGPDGNLYACHDGGVSVSSAGVKSWDDISDGLAVTQLYRLDVDQGRFLFGSQDNGTNYYQNGSWEWLLSGDGMYCAFDPSNTNIMYGSYLNGEIYKSENNGFSFSDITPRTEKTSAGPQGAWVTPYLIDVADSKILYAGYGKVYKSYDRGDTWSAISGIVDADNKITVLRQSSADPNYLLAASIKELKLTKNGGLSWNTIDSDLPDLAITDAGFAFNDPNKIWVAFSGYAAGKRLYYSENAGQSWVNYSKGLPNLPINAIAVQPNTYRALYAGTDLGVYYRNAIMDRWEKCSGNLPAVVVNQLLIKDEMLYAATYGRGIWQSPVYLDSSALRYADFSANSQVVCADSAVTVTFFDQSTAEFDSLEWDFGEYAIPQTAKGKGPHVVSFPYEGDFSIELIGYKGWDRYRERKYHYIHAVKELPVLFADPAIVSCGESVVLQVSDYGSTIWEDTLHQLSFSGATVTYSPEFSSVFSVTVAQGSCSGSGTVSVSYTSDNICSAELLGLGMHGPFSNSCGTAEINEPLPDTLGTNACNTQFSWCSEGGVQHSVWFQIDPGNAEHLYINAPGFDNQIALYEADACSDLLSGPGNFTLLAANDDYNATDQSATIEYAQLSKVGKSYWLQVDGSGGGDKGLFYLDIREDPPLTARFVADTTFIFPGEKIRYANESFGNPYRWEWTFDGGTPSFSFAQHPPEILYEKNGVFSVTLIVHGEEGTDTLVREDYIHVGNTRQICDTVTNFIGTPSLYTLDIGGYLSGTNSLGDRAKAEQFDLTGQFVSGFMIDWVEITFGYASQSNVEIYVSVYDDKSGRPGAELGKYSVKLSDIATDVFLDQPTTVYFDPPVEVGPVFYVGAELPTVGNNLLAIKTNMEHEAIENTAWDLWSNGQWGPFRDSYNLMVSAHVCELPADVADFVLAPNPVVDICYIDLGNFSGKVLSIDVFSVEGERKLHSPIDVQYSNFSVNCSRLAQGIYIVQVITDQGTASKKIVKR